MIVIADDITGAAEIAGIAFQQGFPTRLSICQDGEGAELMHGSQPSSFEILVLATDTRSMSEGEAVKETRRVSSLFVSPPFVDRQGAVPLLFKKTDSALRGHVIPELVALMQTAGYRRAVYLPANPSKRRVIRNGIYLIGDHPIHTTAFSYDPEFPARTSSLIERFPDAGAHHVIMPDAETLSDILRAVHEYNDGHTLFAGAADLFTAFLAESPPPSATRSNIARPLTPAHGTPTLFLCGSTQSTPPDIGLPVCAMPLSVYEGTAHPDLWLRQAAPSYDACQGVVLSIPHRHLTGHDVAVRLRQAMAWMAGELAKIHRPQRLIIEGGATAFACLATVGWHHFQVAQVLAPGVVAMTTSEGGTVILKPGSYPWMGKWAE